MITKPEIEDFIVKELIKNTNNLNIKIKVEKEFKYYITKNSFYKLINRIKLRNIESILNKSEDKDLISFKVSNQKLQDKNRLANKLLREQAKITNSSNELLQELLNKLPKIKDFTPELSNKIIEITERSAIIQLSDLHLNEIVYGSDTLNTNVHNYEIASKRLWKYAKKIKEVLGNKVSYILVAMTGDILNSDRRPDEILMNAGNRSEALIYACQVLSSFLIDLSKDYQIGVTSILGNESRNDLDVVWSNPTHNYDFLIHKFLSIMLSNQTNIEFLEVQRSYERVINICGANILITHGHTRLDWRKAVTKYNNAGIILHYMIYGHLHSTKIDDRYSRSASLVGGNFYSTFNLHVMSRASQNIYIIELEKDSKIPSINPIAIDLQNTEGCDMYSYDKDVCKEGMRKSIRKNGNVIIKIIE